MHVHTHIHTHAHAHAYTHRHIHKHTHTRAYTCPVLSCHCPVGSHGPPQQEEAKTHGHSGRLHFR